MCAWPQAAPLPGGESVAVLRNWPQVADLRAEWNELLRASRADTVFLTWEWIEAWRDVVGHTLQPLVVVARDGSGRLSGLAPFYRVPLRLLRLVPYRALRIMGDFPTGAEYPDWILRRDCEAEGARAIASTLAGLGGEWDCVWMPNVASWTGARDRIAEACREAGLHFRERPVAFSVIDLPSRMDDYVAALSHNRRRDLRQVTRKLGEGQGMSVTSCAGSEDVPRLLDGLFALHHQRWTIKGEAGTFRRKPDEARFYRRFAPVALERGWLRLAALETGGQMRAAQIGYAYNGTFHALQEGFDPACVKGVGHVLRARVIEACIAEGLREYDFLGDVTESKRRALARERTGCDLFVVRTAVKTLPLRSLDLWPTGRYLRPQRREHAP